MCLASLKSHHAYIMVFMIPIHVNLQESHTLTIVANSAQHNDQDVTDSDIA